MIQRFVLSVVLILLSFGSTGVAHATDSPLPPASPQRLYLPLVSNETGVANSLPLGVQMFGATGRESAYFETLQQSGASWVRVPIHWRFIEPTNRCPESYFWYYVDRAVAAAQDAGATIILTHQSNPAWVASRVDGPVDLAPLSEVAEYLAALAERYDGDGTEDAPGSPVVRYFELYEALDDGPVTSGDPQWHDAEVHYGKLLAAVYPAIKAANPDAQVILGGMAHRTEGSDKSLLMDLLAAGQARYFDLVGLHVHPITAETAAVDGIGVMERVTALRTLLNLYQVKKPIIITQAWVERDDFQADLRPDYLMHQASYLVKLFVEALGADVEAAVWYKLYDSVNRADESGLITPLANGTLAEKPLMVAYRTLINQLNGATYQSRSRWHESNLLSTEVHTFRRPDRAIHVAWLNLVTSPQRRILTLDGRHARVVDLYGQRQVELPDSNNDGKLTIEIGPQPLYIHVWE